MSHFASLPADARSAYDAFYTTCDHPRPRGFEAAVVHRLRDYLPPSALLLDVGCGTGALAAALASHGYRAVGVDWSAVAVRRARRERHGGTFLIGDARHLPFPSACFDAVLCSALSLFNVPDLAAALPDARTLTALIRPGGLFIFVGSSALRPNCHAAPSWYFHTLPQFRAFLAALGEVLLLHTANYRLIAWLGAGAFSLPAAALSRVWIRASGRPGAILGVVRVA